MKKSLLALAFAVVALGAASCGSSSSSSSSSAVGGSSSGGASCTPATMNTLHPGQLTIGSDNPNYYPYFTGGPGHEWTGKFNNDPYTDKGFEDAVAYAVASKLGYTTSQVQWQVTHFNQSFAPGPKQFDFYIQEASIEAKRAQNADFSTPYYRANQAVVAIKDTPITKATSLADLKPYKLGTQVGTTSYDFITSTIKPSQQPSAFNTTNDAIHALENKQIDGLVVDLPTAFYMESAQIPHSTIVGQFPTSPGGEEWGLVLAKGSSLTPCVDQALNAMINDGTLAQITKTWLSEKVSAPILH